MNVVAIGKYFLSTLTVIGQVMILLFLISPRFRQYTKRFALRISLAAATLSMAGSLFFSEYAKYTPCLLCWWQRIFMYPQVLLIFIALRKRAKYIGSYLIPMSVIGAIIAGYHYVTQVLVKVASSSCSATGPECTVKYTFAFGYITIPMMAFTAFILIALYTWLYRKA